MANTLVDTSSDALSGRLIAGRNPQMKFSRPSTATDRARILSRPIDERRAVDASLPLQLPWAGAAE